MSRARGRRQALALTAIPEDEPATVAAAGPVAEIMQLIDGLEAAGGCPGCKESRYHLQCGMWLGAGADSRPSPCVCSGGENQLHHVGGGGRHPDPQERVQAAAGAAFCQGAPASGSGRQQQLQYSCLLLVCLLVLGQDKACVGVPCEPPCFFRVLPALAAPGASTAGPPALSLPLPLPAAPLQTRKMQLADFQKAYPGDFKAGALEEIRERYAAMAAAAAAQPAPATSRGTRTGAKRAAEPATVLRTVRARRGPVAPPPKFSEGPQAPPPLAAASAEAETGSRRGARSRLTGAAADAAVAADTAEQMPGKLQAVASLLALSLQGSQCVVPVVHLITLDEAAAPALPLAYLPAEPSTSRRGGAAAAAAAAAGPARSSSGMFLGMPLQTPMPFAGEAVALPITMLTQKRGGKSKAAPMPDAAIITTAGGQAGGVHVCVCGGSGIGWESCSVQQWRCIWCKLYVSLPPNQTCRI